MALDWLIENRIERSLTPCSPNEGCEETSPEAIWSDISYYSEESTSSRQRSSCISSKKVQSIFHSNFVWVTVSKVSYGHTINYTLILLKSLKIILI